MKSINYGLSLASILMIVFITLKVTGNLDWSWVAVILVPFAIDLALALILIVFGILLGVLIGIVGRMETK